MAETETVTTKRTIRTTNISSDIDDIGGAYSSHITPRRSTIRSANSGGGGGGSSYSYSSRSYGSAALGGLSGDLEITNSPHDVVEHRREEKRELQELNDRFATYIERVRFLEQQNRKLIDEIMEYRSKLEKLSINIKATFEQELKEARRLIDDTTKDKARVEIRNVKLEEEIDEYKRKYDELNRLRGNEKDRLMRLELQLSEKDSEFNGLSKKFDGLDGDLDRYKKEIAKYTADLANLRGTNEEEMLLRVEMENKLQSLQEELDFMNQLHSTEVKELMDQLTRDSDQDYKNMFRNELTLAIRDIRTEYENMAQMERPDSDNWYKSKLQEMLEVTTRKDKDTSAAQEEARRARTRLTEINNEILRLRNENGNLEARVHELEMLVDQETRNYQATLAQRDAELEEMQQKMAAQLFELKELMDTKLRLDAEIAAYRRLLEGEENRLAMTPQTQTRVRSYMEQRESGSSSIGGSSMKVVSSESSSKTTFQRSSKGPVSFADVSPDGKFITMENTSKLKDISLDGWKIRRRLDGREEKVFTFPSRYVLKAGRNVKIWASGQGSHRPPLELVFSDSNTWGVGNNVNTGLYTEKDEEKATHAQKTA
ncbi:PREDICTED: muscle cell intermediate filament protein OV71-like [Priapulus caudatus]|uniref:Muscle cell intermediate filament protein OV71-like n=1 Tax=Priapulus caudatus TaxID=37621 RepID=A0ABM1DS02_PRICU|nr:PREDICTED: muscle cell intermediate filament protein OV71-like [Priapulus caudatus]